MSRFDKILAQGTTTSRWLAMPEAKAFLDYLTDFESAAIHTLRTATSPAELHRAQGEMNVLSRILQMRENIRDYQREVSAGKRKPVETQPGKIN